LDVLEVAFAVELEDLNGGGLGLIEFDLELRLLAPLCFYLT